MADAHDLVGFMRKVNRELQGEYDRIRRRARADPGTAGDEGEENWAELFRDWLPRVYQIVTKGKILTSLGETSPQIDVIVLRPGYPKELVPKKHYFSAGVIAAFECKLTLQRGRLRKAVENAVALSRILERERQSDEYRFSGVAGARSNSAYAALHRPLIYGLLAHSHDWKQSSAYKKVSELISEFDLAYVKHPREMLDVICIADLAVWAGERAPYMLGTLPGRKLAMINSAGGCYCGQHLGGRAPGTVHHDNFTTIGCLLAHLMRKLAYLDQHAAEIAPYLIATTKETISGGSWRQWPKLLSDELLKGFTGDWGNEMYF